MSGSSEQSPRGDILDVFTAAPSEPFTAGEISSETDLSLDTVENELSGLNDQGLIQTKKINGSDQVWWRPAGETAADEWADVTPPLTDAPDGQDGQRARQRLLRQHRQLAQLITRIDITDDLDEILRQVTVEARELVGAHQSVTSRTIDQDWAQAINEVSLSDKYADYREYDTEPDGSGIYALACERNEPMRMTQAELESHPAWQAFGDDADDHPPMDGWLAVPIIGPENQNRGLIQLSDKYHGEFTEADEAILIQLANVAAAAIENARLYDELRESEERYRTLVENFPGGAVTLFDEELRYTAAGGENVGRVGVTHDDLVGSSLQEALPDELADQIVPSYRAAIEQEEKQTFEVEYEDTYSLYRAVPVRDDAGDVYAGMGLSQDITDRQEYQRRLEESNNRLEQFAYAASHDLQEPLRMVSSYLQMIDRRYADVLDDEGREFIEFAVDGADRMRRMVDALLEYSRIEAQGDPFEPVDLDDVLDAAQDDLQVKREESDATVTTDELPTVEGDASQLRQVFQNLLDNAIEYSGDAPPRIHVGVDRDGSEWVVSVEDEGIGIDPEHADEVFQVFERLHSHEEYDGTGIGLALCERIVERHDGEMWVTSEPGDGSTFFFTLPVRGLE